MVAKKQATNDSRTSSSVDDKKRKEEAATKVNKADQVIDVHTLVLSLP